MLQYIRFSPLIRRGIVRYQSNVTKSTGVWEYDEDPININKALSHEKTTLPFAYRKESEAFGQIVKNQNYDLDDSQYESNIRVIDRADYLEEINRTSFARDEEGNLIGELEVESKLDPKTVEARTPRSQVKIPSLISKSIQNHILALRIPKRLRTAASNAYVALQTDKIHKASKTPMEADAHIAGMFIQNYASIFQSLGELKKRAPDFNPNSVLDIGFGPATGMIALNELMGHEFKPKVKDAIILGDESMKDKAKILLSRQLNEYTGDLQELEIDEELSREMRAQEAENLEEEEEGEDLYEFEGQDEEVIQRDLDYQPGAIMTHKLKIKTKLLSYLIPDKKYDLIIATHQMLQDASRFPYQVDENVDILLKSLSPNGHLVIVERGNPLGFEITARARQIMVRPEKFGNENGKIPRPYTKNQATKGKGKDNLGKLSEDVVFAKRPTEEEDDLEFEKELKALGVESVEELEKLAAQDLEGSDTSNEIEETYVEPYHLSIVAPCAHHHKCPLQTLRPDYYSTPTGRGLTWCHKEKSVERPRFSLELKRGKVLHSKWGTPTAGRSKKGTAGSGRQNGNNYEIASFSYLIAHRAPNDAETVQKIETERENAYHDDLVGVVGESSKDWPRIMMQPLKKKGHVTMAVCGASGKLEKWTISKSQSSQLYYDARKSDAGDLWALGAKTRILSNNAVNDVKITKIENYLKEKLKADAKRKREEAKIEKRKAADKAHMVEADSEAIIEDKIDVWVERFNSRKQQQQADKKFQKRAKSKPNGPSFKRKDKKNKRD